VALRWHLKIALRADVILSGITQKRALSLSNCRVEENPEGIARSYSSIANNDLIMTGNSRSKLDSAQAWSPYDPGLGVWMAMDLQFVKVVTGVVMQGSKDSNKRVTKFRVEVSRDGLNFRDITPEGNDFAYTGTQDAKQNIVFEKAYMVRYVKIVPTEYNEYASLRAGVLTCGDTFTLIDSGCDPETTFQDVKFDDITRQEVCHAYQRRQLASEPTSQGNGYNCVCQGDERGLTAVWNKKKLVGQCEAYEASSQHSKCESPLPMKNEYVQKRTYTIVSEGYQQSNKESTTGRARVSYKPSSSSTSEIHASYYDHSTRTQTSGKYLTYYYNGTEKGFTPRGFALTVIDQTTLDVVSDDFFYYAFDAHIPDYFDLATELNRLNSEEPGRIVMLTTVDEPFDKIYQTSYFGTLSRLQAETRRMGIQMSEINCDGASECFRSSFAAVGVAGCEDKQKCPSFVTSKWTGKTQDAIKLKVDIEINRCVGVNHGDTCEVKCKPGFTQSNSLATCEDGTWTNMPTCEEALCEGDPSDSDYTILGECPNTYYGESCELECRDGFSSYEEGDMKGVPENARKYSSVWGNNAIGTGHARSTINSDQAWSISSRTKSFENGEEWVELDLGDVTLVRGVIVQARRGYDQRVTEFDVLTCMNVKADGLCENAISIAKFLQYTKTNPYDEEDQKQEFHFDTPVLARKVRFEIRKCHHHCSMRMDVLTANALDDDKKTFDCGVKGWSTCGLNVLRTVHNRNDVEGSVAKIRGADLVECGVDLCTNCDIAINTVLRRDNTTVSKLDEWIESGGVAVLKHVGGETANGDYTLTRKVPYNSNSDWQIGDLVVVSTPLHATSCVNVNECFEDPSLCGSGTCVDVSPTSADPRKYKCVCDPQHHGTHCENAHDDCEGFSDSQMCGHGTCVNVDRTTHNETAFRCECDSNYELDDEHICSIVKTCDGSHFEMTEGMIPFASTNENVPPCEHDGYCHKEPGYCGYFETQGNAEVLVLPNAGIRRLNDADSPDSCLQKCKAETSTEVKGCEYREDGGQCYVHQHEVDAGNGLEANYCFVMSKCEHTSLNAVTKPRCGLSCAPGYKPVPHGEVTSRTCDFTFYYENLCGSDSREISRSVSNVRTPIVLDPVVTYGDCSAECSSTHRCKDAFVHYTDADGTHKTLTLIDNSGAAAKALNVRVSVDCVSTLYCPPGAGMSISSLARCERLACDDIDSDTCGVGATCHDNDDGGGYECKCDQEGYQGETVSNGAASCQELECPSEGCGSYARCDETYFPGYKCVCMDGGVSADSTINTKNSNCLPQLCENNPDVYNAASFVGCENAPSGSTCVVKCADGYQGKAFESLISQENNSKHNRTLKRILQECHSNIFRDLSIAISLFHACTYIQTYTLTLLQKQIKKIRYARLCEMY